MAFKDVLVHVEASETGFARLHLAADVASRNRGRLTAFFLRMPPVPTVDLSVFADLYGDAGVQSGAYRNELQRLVANTERELQECNGRFRQELACARIEGDWRVLDGTTPKPIEAEARYADLIVVGQGGRENKTKSLRFDFPAELALACGRPVLVVPSTSAPAALGERVLVAWNGSRESARALSDALPFLEHAGFVEVFRVESPWRRIEDGAHELAKVVAHLEHCGIRAESFVAQAPEHAVGDAIAERVAHASCDLVVMGAYGHSHMREMVLGGATRTLLQATPAALLLSH